MLFADDEAVKAFIADKSEHRNLTKGQQAMRLALLYRSQKKVGAERRQKQWKKLPLFSVASVCSKPAQFSPSRVSWRWRCAT
jgi:ribosomal protein L44E